MVAVSIRTRIAGSWGVLKPTRVVVFGLRSHIGSLSCAALFPIRLNRSRIDIDVTALIFSCDLDQFSMLKKMANVRSADEEKFRCFFNGHDSHLCVSFSPHRQKRRAPREKFTDLSVTACPVMQGQVQIAIFHLYVCSFACRRHSRH